jgi:RNA polymerase sigma-70 factor (ECF subfamily)
VNEESFEDRLERVLDPAFRLAMTMLNDRTAAEDAVQDAALKAWRGRGRFRAGAELRPWFLAIVANECRSARRARWWRVLRLGEMNVPRREDRVEERLDLASALDRLPPQHLLVLSLYYHLDLPMDEVARVLACSENAARQRLHRALATLRPSMALKVDA